MFAAVLALLTLKLMVTEMVQVCPFGKLFNPHARRIELANAGDCEQKPPGSVTIDCIFAAAGRCSRNITPLASAVPRFVTCHCTVPLFAPEAYVALIPRSVITTGVGVGDGVGIGVGVGVGVGVGTGVGDGVG